MDTPNTPAGRLTEKIMALVGPYTRKDLSTTEYNRLYEALLRLLGSA